MLGSTASRFTTQLTQERIRNMAKYATIVDGAVYRIRDLTPEQVADIPAHKAANILPYTQEDRPAYDSATHHPPVKLDRVISVDSVVDGWAAPVAKTAQEISDEKDAKDTAAVDRIDRASSFDKALGMVLFEVVNKVRVLEGDAPITAVQFKSYLKGKL